MELTGKAKVDFEKWFDDTHKHTMLLWGESVENTGFYELTDSMKYGVYVDWFDSVDICITISHDFHASFDEDEYIVNIDGMYDSSFETRPEARKSAITKATELYNNRV